MLGNCEKMVLISSTTNEWTQIDDPKGSYSSSKMASAVAAATAGDRVMDQKVSIVSQEQHLQQQQQQQQQQKQQQQQQQQNQEALRCPRCDSTNTKFCYYNNYSLTQPRHFCKACKRYWTRGGTLRNVPVGGGCRKNKRVKRPSNNNNNTTTCSSATSLTNNNNSCLEASANSASSAAVGSVSGLSCLSSGAHQIHDLISSGSNHVNHNHHLFYGLPTNHHDINFPFSRYDLPNPPHHQINGLGLGFSSSGLVHNMNSMNIHNNNNNNNQHPQNTKQIFQDLISSNPLLSNYTPTTTTTTTTTTTPTLSSLLTSSLNQMKGANNNFQTLLPSSYEDDLTHMKGNGQNNGMYTKEVKMEFERQNRSIDHHHQQQQQWYSHSQNNTIDHHQISMASPPSDPSVHWANNTGAWLNPSDNNLGSSVPSLI